MPFDINDLNQSIPNSPARWGLRIAWLASNGLTPEQLNRQQSHKPNDKRRVAESMKELCKNLPKKKAS